MEGETKIGRLLDRAREASQKRFGKNINFYHASDRFPAISITGASCALDCKHCKKTLIRRLPAVDSADALLEKCLELHNKGARGVLITGGCTADGRVPIMDFLPAVREVKKRTCLILIAHTGLAGVDEAMEIKGAGIDGVCLDVVGSQETTEEIYNIRITREDYRRTLKAFEKAGMRNISPHVCVGLHYGRMHHELAALETISCIRPTNVVITGLTEVVGTPMQGINIDPEQYVRIMCKARIGFPESYVSAGCARGKGRVREEIDRLAVRAGVNNVAVPTQAAYEEARRGGLLVTEYDACCSLIPEDLER